MWYKIVKSTKISVKSKPPLIPLPQFPSKGSRFLTFIGYCSTEESLSLPAVCCTPSYFSSSFVGCFFLCQSVSIPSCFAGLAIS